MDARDRDTRREIRHRIPRLCDNRETQEGAAMATTAGSAAQPKWMPGHLNRETRRLRLSRGGGAWESPFGPFIVRRFPFPSSPLRVSIHASSHP